MSQINPDEVSRIALLSLMDGSAATIEEAVAKADQRHVNIHATSSTPEDPCWQAATLTALLIAVRAFGQVTLLTDAADVVIVRGPFVGMSLREVAQLEGVAILGTDDAHIPSGINVAVGRGAGSILGRTIYANWEGWRAYAGPDPDVASSDPTNVLAAIAAASLAVSEAFQFLLNLPGIDAGYRQVSLNLWMSDEPEPVLERAPAGWWLVGLGHLGQAYAWVLSHLAYPDCRQVEIFLQDFQLSAVANYSTSVLTPRDTTAPKTRLVATALDRAGFTSRIVERRMDDRTIPAPSEQGHIALIGVDNFAARRIESDMGWRRVIDAGLGAGSRNFTSISLHSFPGDRSSHDIGVWANDVAPVDALPAVPGFDDLGRRFEQCGVLELAGNAVGVPFVGMTAATLAVAAGVSEVNGGAIHEVTNYDLRSTALRNGIASPSIGGQIPSRRLRG